ncbi:SurA N-terminal domain-containing protein [Alcaligenes endophyticus]|uniref:Periplasmic chaperone PpiD n=1 Tax=Alcaligenes endophyticus TaxID=1929088 RepID=A0ABT8EK15_9BURK|nr:SurA N-terminal domain-containing protein [Alcaligenes endophyticus]MCX5591944.1 SurA N-terminal domain-containing protein [Alcaligenes endophyticus]MDN4121634.1 SurA N-terminal domain-containing protein [Alcaligenes endophyticus]
MFEFIRRHQRLMLLVLLVLILPSFVLIGVSGYTNFATGDKEIVQIGDSGITVQEFDQARRAQLEEAQRNSPDGFDIERYDTPAIRQQLLDNMIDQRVLINVATQERFSASDAVLRESIAATPAFQENGVFSPKLYEERLRGAGIEARTYEQSERAQLALARVLEPVVGTAHILPSVVGQLERALTEARQIRVKQFSQADYLEQVDVTDAELQEWYDKNKQSLEIPEQVTAEFLLLDEAAATASVGTPDEAQLQHYYEQNKSRFVLPARAHISHILVALTAGASDSEREQAHAKAKQIATAAQADNANFAELAKTQSEDAGSASQGGDLGWIVYGSWPAALQNAVFSLPTGAVSDVIEGPSGFHIFKVLETEPERGQSFEQAKTQIEQELRTQMAAESFAEIATVLTDLVYENEDSLQPAAQTLGLPLHVAAGITRQGLLDASQVQGDNAAASSPYWVTLNDSRVRQSLFAPISLKDRKNSGVLELSPDTIIALRVADVIPAYVPEFAQVKDSLVERLRHEKALALAVAEGEAELKRLQADNTLERVGFTPAEQVSRSDFGVFTEADLNTIMAVDTQTLPTYVGIQGADQYRLVEVLEDIPGTVSPQGEQFIAARMSPLLGNSEAQAVLQVLRQEQGVKILPAAAEEINPTSQD